VRRTVPPSAEIEKEIEALLAGERPDVHPLELVSELGRLGARLVLQRAVEEEVDDWLGRARYERRAEAAPGYRNGYRPRRLKTAEGELTVEVPQVRDACAPFTSRLFRRRKRFLASEPLRALVIGAFVRGLSMRDVESLCEEAGLGQVSKSTASRLCRELRERFRAFRLRTLIGELSDRGYASAAACLGDDLEALCADLRYPLKHRRVWRSTNLLERSLGEVKRRTKVIGRFPGETSCLSLCWAVLDLVIAGANRLRFDELDRQLIERITAEHDPSHEAEEVIAA